MRRLIPILALALVAACEGPAGPAGPMGPEGPQGPAGPGTTSYFFSGRLDSQGNAAVQLPSEAGSISRLPQIDCFIAEEPNGPFIAVASDTYDGNACGFVNNQGSLVAVLVSGGETAVYAGWYYQIVVRPQNSTS